MIPPAPPTGPTSDPRGQPAACRVCGAVGLETPDDPCPGLCPRCLDDALWAITLEMDLEERRRGGAAALRLLLERLRAIGMTPGAVRAYERRIRETVAEMRERPS